MAQTAAVLVLADLEDAARAALEQACTVAGLSPTVEPSAEVATNKLGQKRFDALVVHMGTPGAALACMRARGKLLRIRIPVIALADSEDDASFARAYRAGADDVLVLGRAEELEARLRALPKPSIPQPGNARGDAVVADADRTRGEVIERVLKDAGFRVEIVADGFAARLQAGRPSLKVAVVDASLDDVPPLITLARAKGSRCAWIVRARPELLDELRMKLARQDRVAVVSAYGPPDDVLFETNRLLEPRASDVRADPRLLHGTIVKLEWPTGTFTDIGYTYNVSPLGLFVRTLLPPAGETVKIEVAPPGSDAKARLEGKVVWRREFGTTRKEPVPAGFGVQITGGDIDAWAEACPRVPSLRPPMPEDVRPTVAPAAVPVQKKPSEHPPGIVAPGEVAIRDPQASVEEMLASVLSETIQGDDGAAPLSMDGGSVVELAEHAAKAAAANGAAEKKEPPPAPPLVAKKEPSPVPPAVAKKEPSPRPPAVAKKEPSPVPPAAVKTEPPAPPEAAKTEPPAAMEVAKTEPPAAMDAAKTDPPTRPDLPRMEPPRPRHDEEPVSIEATDITSASLGFSDLDAIPDLSADVAPDVFDRVTSHTMPMEAAGAATRAEEPAPDRQDQSEETRRSLGNASTMLASAVDSVAVETARALVREMEERGRQHAAPVVPSTPPRGDSYEEELRVPKTRSSALVWIALAAAAGIVVAVVVPRVRGSAPNRAIDAPKVAAVPPPQTALPIAETPPAASAEAPSATTAVSAAAPSAAASAAPSAVAEEPAPAPSPTPAEIASASAPTTPVAPKAVTEENTDADALATLKKGQGFLFVASPVQTNVYVYGNLAGTTNERITTNCGPRFLRLGTAPGHWQSEGFVQIVKCGALTRVEMKP